MKRYCPFTLVSELGYLVLKHSEVVRYLPGLPASLVLRRAPSSSSLEHSADDRFKVVNKCLSFMRTNV